MRLISVTLQQFDAPLVLGSWGTNTLVVPGLHAEKEKEGWR